MSQLGAEIREFLGTAFAGLWVGGEMQRPYRSRSGHFYFELVEKGRGDEVVGRLDAVLFRNDHRRVLAAASRAGVELVEGQAVRCFGGLDVYPPTGRLQLVVRELDPLFSLGALARRRMETLLELGRAGLLDANKQCELSPLPLRLGLVASRGSAGAADFLATVKGSPWAFAVELLDVAVQGSSAEVELIAALQRLDRRLERGELFDAFVLVRGGGSRTDLAVFDSRRVAEQIARARRPVLTGLGHEIDESVADRVAYRAFKTPTGVAEYLCSRVADSERELNGLAARIGGVAAGRVSAARQRMGRLADRLRLAGVRLERLDLRLAELGRRAAMAGRARLRVEQRRTKALSRRLVDPARLRVRAAARRRQTIADAIAGAALRRLRGANARLVAVERLCGELSPRRLLARGFSITRDQGRVVRDASVVSPGTLLTTELEHGTIASRVETVADREETP